MVWSLHSMAKTKAKTIKAASPLIQQTKERALTRNKARLADLLALIRRRVIDVVEWFYDIGEALDEIVEHKLYAAAGHQSLGAFLEAEELLSLSQANKLIAVVRAVPREQALAVGLERAYALVTYAKATPEADSAGGLVAQNANVGGKPAKEASVRGIMGAAREVRAKTKPERAPTSAEREAMKAKRALEDALRRHLRGAGINRADIKVGESQVIITLSLSVAQKATRGA